MRKYILLICCSVFFKSVSAQVFPGDLIITEFMADPVSVTDANGEWIEIFNNSNNNIDLNGFYLSDGGADTMQLLSPTPLIIPPSGYFVFGKNADINSNGGLSINYVMGGFTVNNSNSSIIITDSLFNVIDEITYTTSAPGKSTSLDPFYFDAISNDNPANWCDAVSVYGIGDWGTPGANNPSCGTISVFENAGNYSEVQFRNSDNVLYCNLKSAMKLLVTDAIGKCILAEELSSGIHSVNLEMANGTYVYVLVSDKEVLAGKFIR